MQKNTYGKTGEIVATNYLKKLGYQILANNYKNILGEIDIIARDGEYIVFIEVKTRLSRAFGEPFEAIDYRKQNKIRSVATMYLKTKHTLDSLSRFDAIEIIGDLSDPEINHVKDAF